jgi:nucleoside 2-deoxyribosyltransferase
MKTLYLASPLGFSPENAAYIDRIKRQVSSRGFDIFDPWEQGQFATAIEAASEQTVYLDRVAAFRKVASQIGACNEEGIRKAEVVLAVVDGAEIDSGTASEVGFASALGKRCYGLRTDLRDSGDFIGIPVNLQVLHFIERSGGVLFRSIADIVIDQEVEVA